MAASGTKRSHDEELGEEAWIRTADGEQMLRLRRLNYYLRQGVVVSDVRVVEGEDGLFSIWLRLSNRGGEFQLYKQEVAEPKVYKDLGLAVATIRREFSYIGTIALQTDRRPPKAE